MSLADLASLRTVLCRHVDGMEMASWFFNIQITLCGGTLSGSEVRLGAGPISAGPSHDVSFSVGT